MSTWRLSASWMKPRRGKSWRAGYERLQELHERALAELENVIEELAKWKVDGDAMKKTKCWTKSQRERERASRAQIQRRLSELRIDMTQTGRDIGEAAEALAGQDPESAWEQIEALARRESSHVADIFVLQTQIRANLIELEPVEFEQQEADRLCPRQPLGFDESTGRCRRPVAAGSKSPRMPSRPIWT